MNGQNSYYFHKAKLFCFSLNYFYVINNDLKSSKLLSESCIQTKSIKLVILDFYFIKNIAE